MAEDYDIPLVFRDLHMTDPIGEAIEDIRRDVDILMTHVVPRDGEDRRPWAWPYDAVIAFRMVEFEGAPHCEGAETRMETPETAGGDKDVVRIVAWPHAPEHGIDSWAVDNWVDEDGNVAERPTHTEEER